MEPSISLSTTIASLKVLWNFVKKIYPGVKNFLFRPKLEVDLQRKTVVFVSQDGKEQHHGYLCLLITNTNKSNKNYHINLNSIRVNDEFYQVFIQMEDNFLLLNHRNKGHWKECKNEIYNLFYDNWSDILQNNLFLQLKPFDLKIFPLVNKCSSFLTKPYKGSLIFLEKTKIIITLEIDKKIYEYSLDRTVCYERCINHSVSAWQIYKN